MSVRRLSAVLALVGLLAGCDEPPETELPIPVKREAAQPAPAVQLVAATPSPAAPNPATPRPAIPIQAAPGAAVTPSPAPTTTTTTQATPAPATESPATPVRPAAPAPAAPAKERRLIVWHFAPAGDALGVVEQALARGEMPARGTLDVAALIANFTYDVPPPPAEPFSLQVTLVRAPWNGEAWLLHVRVRGADHPIPMRLPGDLAADMPVSIEIDPTQVARIRAIGGDKVEVAGPGRLVQAMYELTPARPWAQAPMRSGRSQPVSLGEVRVRWRVPLTGEPPGPDEELKQPIAFEDLHDDISDADAEARFAVAVAAFGQVLTGERAVRDFDFSDVETMARDALGPDPLGKRARFLQLVRTADEISSAAPLDKPWTPK